MRSLLHWLRARWRWRRLSDEEQWAYAIVTRELADGAPEPTLWAEVQAEQSGDAEQETRYIRRRIDQLLREAEHASGELLASDVDRLAPVLPPIDTGRWSPAYQRVLDATTRGTLHFGLYYYLAMAVIFAFALAVANC